MNQALEIPDIYDISYHPWWMQSWFLYVFFTLSFLVIIGVTYFYYKKNKKIPKKTAQEKAFEKLKELEKSTTHNHKEFYMEVTSILKQFFYDQYHIDVIGATDAELLKKIDESYLISSTIIEHIKTILDGVTLIKFANASAAKEQMQEALGLSFSIIDSTQRGNK